MKDHSSFKYDFTSILNREGRDAVAVDVIPIREAEVRDGFSKIPMWVADMNFPTAPVITNALIERASHPAYGYFFPQDEYFDAIAGWHEKRYGVAGLTREDIGHENGVLGGVVSAVQAFSAPGDCILVHSPTYIGFTHVLEANGRKIVLSDLKPDSDGILRMDYEDMAVKLRENKIHLAVFCSPHNPAGRVWERDELERAMEVFRENDCIVVSDEIWADLVLRGHRHIPTASVSEDARERTVGVYAPTKTFNLAGLVGSYHVIQSQYLRDRVVKQAGLSSYNHLNVMSYHALIAAYKDEGTQWLDELLVVLGDNVDYAYDYITKHFEDVSLAKPQGTYMLFLDCEKWCAAHGKTLDDLLKAGVEVGVIWQDGRPFHGEWSIRMNLALPLSRVAEAMDRLDEYVFNAK